MNKVKINLLLVLLIISNLSYYQGLSLLGLDDQKTVENEQPRRYSIPILASNNISQESTKWGNETLKEELKTEVQDTLNGFVSGFIENKGQKNEEIYFYTESPEMGVGFGTSEIRFSIINPRTSGGEYDDRFDEQGIRSSVTYTTISLAFLGSNQVIPVAEDPTGAFNNYFVGSEEIRWVVSCQYHTKVIYYNIYENIDLIYELKDGKLKYEFFVYPGGKIDDIKLHWTGPVSLELLDIGIQVTTHQDESLDNDVSSEFSFIDTTPICYQSLNREKPIEGDFNLFESTTYGFYVPNYDPKELLIIDPLLNLTYSSYVGGSVNDRGEDIAVDGTGNAYVTGYTYSTDFPAVNAYEADDGGYDVFVFKLNSTGNGLLYSTYVGGSEYDLGHGIALDEGGNAYVTGRTFSDDFPSVNAYDTTNDGSYDVFVFKLNSTGNGLLFSTYIGGNSDDYGYSIALDGTRNAYVTGYTLSTDFPTVNAYEANDGGEDVFVFKLSSAGNELLYSTYVGGSGYDIGQSIALDAANNAYVTGYTSSTDFPTVNAYEPDDGGDDVFVFKLAASGNSLIYSTYVGGSTHDRGYDIAVDGTGNAYITGWTDSTNFPTVNAYEANDGGRDIFVFKLNSTGNGLMYSTYIGGSNDEEPGYHGVVVDVLGNTYVTGWTRSTNFPAVNAYNSNGDDNTSLFDLFVLKLNSAGSGLLYSTYVTGSDNEKGNAIALDGAGNVYFTGNTDSADFPTINAYNMTGNGGQEVFVSRFSYYYNPLYITTNSNFTALGIPGAGTPSNPYVIEGSSFINSTTTLIHIQDTTSHFIIRNNWLNGITGANDGIYLNNVSNGIITNNNIGYCSNGVNLYSSFDNLVTNNNIFNSSIHGVYIQYFSGYNNISRNTISNCSSRGINIHNSSSSFMRFEWNNFIDNGLSLPNAMQAYDDGWSNTFNYNYWNDWISPDADGDGLIDIQYPLNGSASSYDPHPLAHPYYGYLTRDPIYIDDNTDFGPLGYNFTGSGTQIDPYLIEGYNITDNTQDLIEIRGTTFYFEIKNCLLNGINNSYYGIHFWNVGNGTIEDITLYNCFYGLYIQSSQDNNITNSDFFNNSQMGIYLSSSSFCRFTDNNVSHNNDGILIWSSSNNIFSENIVYNNSYGITLYWSSTFLNYITNNTVYNNTYHGIFLGRYIVYNFITGNTVFDNLNGIHLWIATNNTISSNELFNNINDGISIWSESDYNRFFDNLVFNNLDDGIGFYNASYNIFQGNIIFNNIGVGIDIDSDCKNNTVTWNHFLGNNLGGTQAIDGGLANLFSYNYWDDHPGPDSEPDGLFDSPYNILGGTNSDPYPLTQPFTPHTPIYITKNSDFATLGFPGTGTVNDPYVIEQFFIINSTTHLIYIEDTTVHFFIRNNVLDCVNGSPYGIFLENVTNGAIINNTIHSGERSIHIWWSANIIITDNTIFNISNQGIYVAVSEILNLSHNIIFNTTASGIYLSGCNKSVLSGNTIHDCNERGIILYLASNCTVSGNSIFSNNLYGIILDSSIDINVSFNTLYNNQGGISLSTSSNNSILSHNTIFDNDNSGVYLSDFSNNNSLINNIIYNNSVHGIRLTSVNNNIVTNNTIFKCDLGILVVASSNNNIFNNNIYQNSYGIYLQDSTDNTLAGNSIYNNTNDGIYFKQIGSYNTTYNTIHNNTISNNLRCGIYLEGSVNNTIITNNTIHSNTDSGIRLWFSPNYNTISNNTIYNNGQFSPGISLYSSAQNNNVTNNHIYDNPGRGIILEDSSNDNFIAHNILTNNSYAGVTLINYCTNNDISDNTISNNEWGINIFTSVNNNTIYDNTIYNNSRDGIILGDSSGFNLIYLNSIFSNNESQANDDNGTNSFYYNGLGNYWSNAYTGLDLNGDSIGDIPYSITGSASNQDPFPLMYPVKWYSNFDVSVIEGDWIITGTEYHENKIITLTGNITFPSNGSLTLHNVILRFNCSYDGEFHIEVDNGGILTIEANSTVTTANPTHAWYLKAFSGTILLLKDSTFTFAGYDSASPGDLTGLWINTDNAQVNNCVMFNNFVGLYLHQVDYGIVHNNSISYSTYRGFVVRDSTNNTVSENFIFNNSAQGIYVTSAADENTFVNNMFLNNGIYVTWSAKNEMINNTFQGGSGYGIGLDVADYSVVVFNRIFDITQNGIDLRDSNNCTIYNNTIFSNGNYGIRIENANYSNITKNIIYNNGYGGGNNAGIYLYQADYSIISSNIVNDNWYAGIELVNSCDDNIINHNFVSGTNFGFRLFGTPSTCERNILFNNTVYNTSIGILEDDNLINSTFSKNTIFNNTGQGIQVQGNYTEVFENTIFENVEGIFLHSSSSNSTITLNAFIDNNQQARDDGTYNAFSYNYWNDHTSPDQNYDGIVDTPYSIAGSANNSDDYPLTYSFIFHEPIFIDENADFAALGFPGNGTELDPYIIQGYYINSSSSRLIDIRSTSAFVIIRNCFLDGVNNSYEGIFLQNVTHLSITNITLYRCVYGIMLRDFTFNNTIANSTIAYNSDTGIYLYNSPFNNSITNNRIFNDTFYGIRLYNAPNNTLLYNMIYNNTIDGIVVENASNNCIILGNTVSKNARYGIYVAGSDYCNISTNLVFNNSNHGLYLWQSTYCRISSGNTIYNNTGHGISLSSSNNNRFYNNTIHDNGQFGFNVFLSSNNTLSNNTINNNSNYGIILFSSSNNNNITENIITNNGNDGISLQGVSNNNLVNNTITGHTHGGIYLEGSSNQNVMSNNSIINCDTGILVSASDSNEITDNFILDSLSNGISLSEADHNIIANNVIINPQAAGMMISQSTNNTFISNLIANSTAWYGIYLVNSANNNTFSYNIIEYNDLYGIYLTSSSANNTVIWNNFIGNNLGVSQAYDNSPNNTFKYNYWDDSTTPDTDPLDGYVDTPYSIDGGSNTDSYPRAYPYFPHASIYIGEDADFVTLGFPGQGTENDPYIIEEYFIINSTTQLIYVRNTTAYFIIRNNLLNGINGVSYGICLDNTTHGLIVNNKIVSSSIGIIVLSSSNSTVHSNTIYNSSYYGLILMLSDNNTISSNIVYNNTHMGIIVQTCINNTLFNNTIYNNFNDTTGYGIVLNLNANSNTILNNTIYNNINDGIWVNSSTHNTISSNRIYNNSRNGIFMNASSSHNTLSDNTLYNNSENGISLESSAFNNTVMSNSIYNNSFDGIAIDGAHNNTLLSNVIQDQDRGISLAYSMNTTCSYNSIYNSSFDSIRLYYANYTTIIGNNVSNNAFAGMTLGFSYHNIIINNTFSNNNIIGIYILYSSYNLVMTNLISNHLNDTWGIGIMVSASMNNTINNNTISDNINYGIMLGPDSANNTIKWNDFLNNNPNNTMGLGHSQAYDNGTSNLFTNNFWSDWTGPDTEPDGIVDYPYIINGSAGNSDLYPVTFSAIHELSIPIVLFPNGGETLFGTISIEWTAAIDSYGYEVTYEVLFSANNGTTWVSLTSGLTGLSRLWDTTSYLNSTTYLIRVIATSDGLEEEDISDGTFTIQNPPVHLPIIITSDTDFAALGFPGDGTESNPYIIEGLYIANASMFLIVIQDTTAYFIIRDNTLNGISGEFTGIYLFNVNYGTIENNQIYNCSNGISIDNSKNNVVFNNEIHSNYENGIFLLESSFTDISANTIRFNGANGVFLINSNENTISDNIIYGNGYNGAEHGVGASIDAHSSLQSSNRGNGIFLDPADDNMIYNNDIYDNFENGIYLLESDNTNISSNTINGNGANGVFLNDSKQNIISDNVIFGNGYNGAENGVGASVDVYSSLQSSNRGNGIFLDPADDNSIYNNNIYGNIENGVYLLESDNSLISNNTINDNGANGVFLKDSNENYISDNIIFENGYNGAEIGIGASIDATAGLQSSNRGNGIFLDPADDNIISFNSIYDNFENGIYILESETTFIFDNSIFENGANGIFLAVSSYTQIFDNIINFNGYFPSFAGVGSTVDISTSYQASNRGNGIYLGRSDDNNISNNVISNNTNYGVNINESSDENVVEWNDFFGNNPDGDSQAFDEGSTNLFSYNYWDDHDNLDKDGDGVADEKYSIDGSANNLDLSPIATPEGGLIDVPTPLDDPTLIIVLVLLLVVMSGMTIAIVYRKRLRTKFGLYRRRLKSRSQKRKRRDYDHLAQKAEELAKLWEKDNEN